MASKCANTISAIDWLSRLCWHDSLAASGGLPDRLSCLSDEQYSLCSLYPYNKPLTTQFTEGGYWSSHTFVFQIHFIYLNDKTPKLWKNNPVEKHNRHKGEL